VLRRPKTWLSELELIRTTARVFGDERLVDYIQNQTFSTKLDADDIARSKRATLQLAQMDQQFVGKT